MKTLTLIVACLLLSSCKTEEKSSEVTSIDMNLPDRGGLKEAVSDIEAKMNAYRLVVTPVDVACANATSVDQLDEYVNSAKISASLVQGCDYDVTLSLGHRPTDQEEEALNAGTAKVVSYEGKIQALVQASCVKCHGKGQSAPELTSFDLVKAAGAAVVRQVEIAKMPIGASLSEADKALFTAWQTGGFAEKDQASATLDKTKLSEVYYTNETALRITKDQIQGQASLKVSLALKLQDAGRAIGLGSK